MRYFIGSLLFIFMSLGSSFSQSINGIIIDINDEPVINAIVKIIDSEVFTLTDIDGKFSIEASKDAILEISHISFSTILVPSKDAQIIVLSKRNISLDEIVVKSHPLDDITHSVVITDKIKKGSQPRNLADLFNDIPGFSLQKRSSMALEPSFRSFKYEEMNIKYDGAAKIVHACPNRMDPITAHVIPEEVSKIEIVKGPYTVRFGQRFGPTVNMVTKTPKPDSYGFNGSIEGGYETNGNNLVARAQLQYAQKKYDLTLNGESRDFGNYTDGNGTKVSSSFKTQSYSIKIGLNPTKKQRFQLDFRQKFGQDIMHSGLPMDSPKDNSYLMSLDYKIKKPSKKIHSFLIKGYYSSVDHLMSNELRPNFDVLWGRTPVVSSTLGGKTELGLTPNNKTIIYMGLDADIIKRDGHKFVTVKTNSVGIPFDPPIEKIFNVWHDATTQDFGAFVEGNYRLTSDITANAGIRIDFISARIDDPDSGFEALYNGKINDTSEATLGGNISFKYRKNDLQLQLAYGRGTRSASMIERYIYRFTIGSDSRDYIGNPYLKPEINNQIEFSAIKQFEKVSFGSSIFYSLMKNYITAKINSGFIAEGGGGCGGGTPKAPKQFWNVNAYQYGFDAFLKYNILDHFQFSSDLAYTYAQNTTFNEPLAQVGPFNGHIGLKWEKKKYWIDFRTRITAKQDRYSSRFNESETAGYTLLDLRTGIKPIKNLTIGISVLNILDKAYYSHLNFAYNNSDENAGKIFEQGRSFSMYIKYKF